MIFELETGDYDADEYLTKLFYALYPDLKLAINKDENNNYIDSMKSNITQVCGVLNERQMQTAMIYYLGILNGFDSIEPQEYSEIREELNSYVPSY